MPLNIRSEKANALAEELASIRNINKTEAVCQALTEAVQKEKDRMSFMDRIKVIQDRIASYPSTGLEADKAFYDSLNDE